MTSTNDDKLFKAIKNNNLFKVKNAIRKGANVNAVNKHDLTPIQLAMTLGNIQIIYEIIFNGADLNRKFGHNKMTALHYAVHLRNIELIKILIQQGADPNAEDLNKDTPLQLAIIYHYDEIIRYFDCH